MSDSYQKLKDGYKKFRTSYLDKHDEGARQTLSTNQSPKTMFISCVDSRTPPTILTQANLGEIFCVSCVANIVPPHTHPLAPPINAAIAVGVGALKVEHIILLAHSDCGGIKALLSSGKGADESAGKGAPYMKDWVGLLEKAKESILADDNLDKTDSPTLQTACEKKGLILSLKALNEHPLVKEAVSAGRLQTYGWYFDIKSGEISVYSQKSRDFSPLI